MLNGMTEHFRFRLDILACPRCRGLLAGAPKGLRCLKCNQGYPIIQGVPVLFPDGPAALYEYSAPQFSPAYHWLRSRSFFPALRRAYHLLGSLDEQIAPATPLDRSYNLRWAFRAINALDQSDSRSVLDCGGTDGRYRSLMCRNNDEYWNLEVDRSVQRLQPGDMGLIGDIHHAPILDQQFDIVVMLEVLEHLFDPSTAVAECFRILKPGGFLFLTTPQYCMIHAFPHDYYRYTIQGLRFITERAGFQWVQHHPMGGKWLLFYFMVTRSLFPILRQPPLNVLANLPLLLFFVAIDTVWLRFRPLELQRNADTYGWAVLVQKPKTTATLRNSDESR